MTVKLWERRVSKRSEQQINEKHVPSGGKRDPDAWEACAMPGGGWGTNPGGGGG